MKDNPKRVLILRAGSECFARFGFDKTTLEDIGRRAGLNKASLYYYFQNKEDIFMAVVKTETKAFLSDLQNKSTAYPDTRKQIRFYLTERIRRYGEIIHLNRLSVDNLLKLGPQFDEMYQENKAFELAYLTGLMRKASTENILAVNETSVTLSEHLFQLSEAFKNNTVHAAGRFIAGELDFAPGIAELEFWIKLILR